MRPVLFVLHVLCVVMLPPVIVALSHGTAAPFWFLAGDSYLYLGIAQNSQGMVFSFDGERATNGFHPLWQVVVRLLVTLWADPLAQVNAVFWLAVALVLSGALMLGLAIRRLTGSWLLAALSAPGVYFLLFGQGLQHLGPWAFIDGMEGALAWAIGGAVALWLARGGSAAGLGMLLALLVLTRLDEVFGVAATAMAVLLWPGTPVLTRLRRAAAIAVPAGAALALYFTWSLSTTGLLMPVSGAAKGEGGLLGNAWVTLATFFAPLIDLRIALTGYDPDRAVLLGGAFRVVQLLMPAALAAILVVVILRHFRRAPWAAVVVGLGLGVMAKAGYHFTLVNFWHQAGWYFAFAVIWLTLAAALVLGPGLQALARRAPLAPAALGGLLGVFGLLHGSLHGSRHLTEPLFAQHLQFWQDRAGTQAALTAAVPQARVLEFGDGFLNFALQVPVRHGFVFAGDAQSLDALRAGGLLRDAYADGYRLLSSYEYLGVPPGAEAWHSDEIRAFLAASVLDPRVKAELDLFDFAMVHVHRPSNVPFIELRLRD